MKPSLSRLLFFAILALAAEASAEPMFLSRQYTRCTTCHYSPTGGGLLTPYGRSLTQELSTTGSGQPADVPGHGGEQDFLWGRLGSHTGPLDLGIDIRPAHLNVNSSGFGTSEDFLMNADLVAAIRTNGWTFYGEIGREPVPRPVGPKIASYEYWVGHESDHGFGFRLGRFLPAYGIRVADHTAFTRLNLGFDVFDQVMALELSHSGARHLLQISIGPGPADSAFSNDGRRAFTTTGRFQIDLSPRSALVFSGLYRNSSATQPQMEATGIAYGFSPNRHISIWTEADAQLLATAGSTAGGTGYTLLNETSFEVHRGVWIKLSPQIRTDVGSTSGGVFRTVVEADLFPRTHFNPDISVYRDVDRASHLVTRTILAQFHFYF